MKGTIVDCLPKVSMRSDCTLGQLCLGHVGEVREVVVTWGAEMGGTKTEEHSNGAAVVALVLEKVSPVLAWG